MKTNEDRKAEPISTVSADPATAPRTNPDRDPLDASAFAYCGNARLNLEKGIRSVSCLLTLMSEIGNDQVNGWAAHGLAATLDWLADYSQGLYSKEEMAERGGAPYYTSTENLAEIKSRVAQSGR